MTSYEAIRDQIRDGDFALMRNGGIISRLSGKWTHAAPCVWLRDRDGNPDTLMLAESREWFGGRLVTLSSQVTKYAGNIDIFRPDCDEDIAHLAAVYAAKQAGHPYGWGSILIAALNRLVLVRLLGLWRPETSDMRLSSWNTPKMCSQLLVWSFRKAAKSLGCKFDLLPFVNDAYAEPSMLPSGRCHLLYTGLVHRGEMELVK